MNKERAWKNSYGQLKKVEFLGIFMKNSCGIFMCLGF